MEEDLLGMTKLLISLDHLFVSDAIPRCDSANGWRSYNGMCYRYFTYRTTWQTAENDCKLTPGGRLAYAKSEADQTFLDNLQYVHGKEYWIGLSDKVSTKAHRGHRKCKLLFSKQDSPKRFQDSPK